MRISRPVLLAAALILLVAALLLMTGNGPLAPPNTPPQTPERSGVWLNDLRTVQVGGQPAAWIGLAGKLEDADGRILVVDVFSQPPPRRVVLLQGPWAGAAKMDEFGSRLKTALAGLDWPLEVSNFSELSSSSEGRILILPSGAWPQELMRDWKGRIGPQDMVIYLGVRQNVTLDAQGGMNGGAGVLDALLAEGPSSGFVTDGELLDGPGGGIVWRIPHTLGEYDDLRTLADELAQGMVSDPAGRALARRSVVWQRGGRTAALLLPPGWDQEGFARVRLVGSDGLTQTVWDSPLHAPGGDIEGPATSKMGQTAAFQIRLQPGLPQDERIRYRAALYAPNQSRFDVLDLGEGVIKPGGAWVGSFTYNAWPAPGDWRVVIEDQFGRSYAEAAVHVIGYSIDMLEPLGNTYRFLILRDGVPLPDGPVQVRRAGGGDWQTANLNQGVLSLSANWDDGGRGIEVDADGAHLHYEWGQEQGPWAVVWRWGVPGLLVAGLLYWLLRPRTRPTYRIRIGELPMIESKRVSLSMEEMEAVMEAAARRQGWEGPQGRGGRASRCSEWALRAEDVMESLHQAERGGKPVMASLESVEEALDGLVKEGRLRRWREWYGLAGRGVSEKDIRQRSLGKMLKDRLLEMGTDARPMRSGGRESSSRRALDGYEDEMGRQWLIFAPDAWKERIGRDARTGKDRLPRFIVFADRTERDDFARELAREAGPGMDRLRLGMRTGRVKLTTIKEMAGR